ncbi:MAG: S-methyl-5'-thioadenosine phosphorylase, partial [bacterium]
VIGMTNATEAKLAREAELCYVTISLVTDYDCWHETEEDVSVEAILQIMHRNVVNAKNAIAWAAGNIEDRPPCHCGEALRFAIVTDPAAIPAEVKRDLAVLIGKYVK